MSVCVPKPNILTDAKKLIQEKITPFADQYAMEGRIPDGLIGNLAAQRLLGTLIDKAYGGLGINYSDYGKLTRMIGQACSSVRSLLTVHDMVAYAVTQFGSPSQKSIWLPQLATGEKIAAFALTEPELGSSVKDIQTTVSQEGEHLYVTGSKVWISYGQVADVFLVFAKLDNAPVALLVPRDAMHLTIKPIPNPLGFSASMIAELHFENTPVHTKQMLGAPGIGLSFIANQCLSLGRYSVACGALGIIDACICETKAKVNHVKPNGSKLIDFQQVGGMVSDMLVHRKMLSLLCKSAAQKMSHNFAAAVEEIMMAKYVGGKFASQSANDALQIAGAQGHAHTSPLRRYLHDAKVCELIEGSNEIMRTIIGKNFVGYYGNSSNNN